MNLGSALLGTLELQQKFSAVAWNSDWKNYFDGWNSGWKYYSFLYPRNSGQNINRPPEFQPEF